MSRHSGRLVWSHSIAQLGFPECPAYMTEPAYARLAFEPVCHVSVFYPIYWRAILGSLQLGVWHFWRSSHSFRISCPFL
jgi:hypothetical protein